MSLLGDRLVAVEDALTAAGIPHAFGGAIALGYCAAEARGTRDLDVNLFVGPEKTRAVFAALPHEVTYAELDVEHAERDGQVRLHWGITPVDLFFDVHDFHKAVAESVRIVPFLGRQIPVIGCVELVVFKAMFNRTRDWADIEDVAANGVNLSDSVLWLGRLLGEDDEITKRLRGLMPPSSPAEG